MARLKAIRLVTNEAFDATQLDTQDLAIHNLCGSLADLPRVANLDSLLSAAQIAYREKRFVDAIATLRAFLAAHGLLNWAGHRGDAKRFSALRNHRGIRQQDIAAALGVSTAAVSHFENGRSSLGFPKLLLAAAALDVAPDQLVRPIERL